jgi:peptide/nickel transport system substrate-binding protein
MGLIGRHLWSADVRYPALDALLKEWKQTTDLESRKQVLFQIQELMSREPTAIALYYPVSTFAYRPAAYDNWVESPGFGIVNKWSFLSAKAREGAVVTPR